MSTIDKGIRADIAKRLRQAIHKLIDKTIDLEVERLRVSDDALSRGDLEQRWALDAHVDHLRRKVARVVVEGETYLTGMTRAALAAADAPAPRPSKVAPQTPPKPEAPPRKPSTPKSYVVDLSGVDRGARAGQRTAGPAALPAHAPRALPPAGRQEQLFPLPGIIDGELEEER